MTTEKLGIQANVKIFPYKDILRFGKLLSHVRVL